MEPLLKFYFIIMFTIPMKFYKKMKTLKCVRFFSNGLINCVGRYLPLAMQSLRLQFGNTEGSHIRPTSGELFHFYCLRMVDIWIIDFPLNDRPPPPLEAPSTNQSRPWLSHTHLIPPPVLRPIRHAPRIKIFRSSPIQGETPLIFYQRPLQFGATSSKCI